MGRTEAPRAPVAHSYSSLVGGVGWRDTSILQTRKCRATHCKLGPGHQSPYFNHHVFSHQKYFAPPGMHLLSAPAGKGWLPAQLPSSHPSSGPLTAKALSGSGTAPLSRTFATLPPPHTHTADLHPSVRGISFFLRIPEARGFPASQLSDE